MIDYLFATNPGVLHPQTEVLTASFILLALYVLGVFILKRRREFIKLNKDQRLALRAACKVNTILSAVLLLFIVFRVAQVNFLSMRFFAVALLASIVVIFIIAIVKIIKFRESQQVLEVTADEYAKYLPHKKKK